MVDIPLKLNGVVLIMAGLVLAAMVSASCTSAPIDRNIGAKFIELPGRVTVAAKIAKDVRPLPLLNPGTLSSIGQGTSPSVAIVAGITYILVQDARNAQTIFRYSVETESAEKFIVYSDVQLAPQQCVTLRIRADSRGEFYLEPHKSSLEPSNTCK